MQNIKGAIRIFAILMAVSCLFYLSFSFVTRKWEDKAHQYAENYIKQPAIADWVKAKAKGDAVLERKFNDSIIAERERFYLHDSIAGKKIYLGLYTYESCKDKELNLGLDLKGGMNVTMEVSTPDVVRALANNPTDVAFDQAIKNAVATQKAKGGNFVDVFAAEYKKLQPQGRLARLFGGAPALKKYDITFNSEDNKVVDAIRSEVDLSVENAKNVLETRVNQFGVAQPNIQHLKGTNRILVELPGVKDEDRVKKLLQGQANLEFYETYHFYEIAPQLGEANNRLMVALGYKIDSLRYDSTGIKTPNYKDAKTKEDSAKVVATAKAKFDSAKVVIDSINKVRTDTSKVGPDKKGASPFGDYIIAQNPDQKEGKGPMVFGVLVKDTAKIGALLRRPELKGVFPADLRFAWTAKPKVDDKERPYLELIALRADKKTMRASMPGDVVTEAKKVFDSRNGSGYPEISMTMNAQGTKDWARLTKANTGRSIAIVLDGYVYTYPNVNGEITGGVSSITGAFTIKEVDDVVTVLSTGKLPAPTVIIEQTVIGPTLGAEAIRAGMISFIVALVVVLLYMGFYYNKAGWVADVALFVNVFFIMGILSSLGAVLTLPGIAGIVLTIALSVDANILIFERVREELREGKSLASAIGDGYKHAMSSILDSNLTTLILGIILFAFGSGPVQGFATTLIIGIISSLFCAIFITRLIFDRMLKKDAKIGFSIPATEHILRNTKIDFVGKRKLYYIFSLSIITLGVIFYVKNGGFSKGVDFSGGRSYTVRFDKDVDREKVAIAIAAEFGGLRPEVKTAGGDAQLKITTNYKAAEDDTAVDREVSKKLYTGIEKAIGTGVHYEQMSSIKIGASIAEELITKSIVVIVISCLLMFLYILFRFRKWQYGLGAVAALFHDVLVILSCYAIFDGILPFPLEMDQHFIAAILTVMGYSMTDTVVVFDRIREFLALQGKTLGNMDKTSTINYALNSTLSRTINTSMITFFVLLSIFIFGGETIRGFSFALLIGIVIGTYSSLCIATPIVVDLDRRKDESKA